MLSISFITSHADFPSSPISTCSDLILTVNMIILPTVAPINGLNLRAGQDFAKDGSLANEYLDL